ncbi:MAG: hypothetical protein QOF92_4364 [Pseudonocardiales bacterium]|nr:hypothetical protein [Pseudonocardiales bacterium]
MMRARRTPARGRPRHATASLLAPTRSVIIVGGFAVLAVAGIAGCAAVAGTSHHYGAAHGPVVPHLDTESISVPDQVVGAASIGAGAVPGVLFHRVGTTPSATAGPEQAATGSDTAPSSSLAASGIPTTALTAYKNAAAREANRLPGCGINWTLLAGIGRVESNHGRFAGAVLHSDGYSVPRIVGIPLNGNGTAVITDTDGGRLDGDKVYDRAVGPMQFIPSTWAGWAVDANHDGSADPNNIFDAAAAAADYLCAAGRNLHTYSGEVQAVRSYNNSDSYITMVLQLERVYASGVVGVTVPVLPTDPNPVTVKHPKHPLPPVDPGKPRGVEKPKPKPKPKPHPAPHPTHTGGSACPTPTATSTTTAAAPSSGSTGSSSTKTCPTPTPSNTGSTSTTPPDPLSSSASSSASSTAATTPPGNGSASSTGTTPSVQSASTTA